MCRFHCELENGIQILLSDFDFVRVLQRNTELEDKNRKLKNQVHDLQSEIDSHIQFIQNNMPSEPKESLHQESTTQKSLSQDSMTKF